MNNNEILLLIRQLELSLEQLGKNQLSSLDISPVQGLALGYLLSRRDRTVYATDLHEQLGFSKASISAVLNGLKDKGYLEMVINPGDTRKKQLIPTPRAREIEHQINASLSSQQKAIYRGISPDQQRQMEMALNTMLSNIKQTLVRRNDT